MGEGGRIGRDSSFSEKVMQLSSSVASPSSKDPY